MENKLNFDLCNQYFQPTCLDQLHQIWEKIRKDVINNIYLNPYIFFKYLWNPNFIIPYNNTCNFFSNVLTLEEKFFHPKIGPGSYQRKYCLSCQRLQRMSNYRADIYNQCFKYDDQYLRINIFPFYPKVSIKCINNKNIINIDKNSNRLLTSWIIQNTPNVSNFFVNNYFSYICCNKLITIEDDLKTIDLKTIDIKGIDFEEFWKEILIQLLIISITLQEKRIIHGDLNLDKFHIVENKGNIFFKNKEYTCPFLIKLEFTGKCQIEIDEQNIIQPYSIFSSSFNQQNINQQFFNILRLFLKYDSFYQSLYDNDDICEIIWKNPENIDDFNPNCIIDLINII